MTDNQTLSTEINLNDQSTRRRLHITGLLISIILLIIIIGIFYIYSQGDIAIEAAPRIVDELNYFLEG